MEKREAKKILLVDDEHDTVEMITTLLELEGYKVYASILDLKRSDFWKERSKRFLRLKPPSIWSSSILCSGMPMEERSAGDQGDEEMKFIPIIMLTVRSSLQDKIDSLNIGADDYLTKPFVNEELLAKSEGDAPNQGSHDELKRERNKNVLLTPSLGKEYSFGEILGKEWADARDYQLLSDISDTDSTVLIQGESGTGKELIAKGDPFQQLQKE